MNDYWFGNLNQALILGSALLALSTAHADCLIIDRNSQGDLEEQTVSDCADLSTPGARWTVLRGEEADPSSAVSWTREELLRAQTIHYHLRKAEIRTQQMASGTRILQELQKIQPFQVRFDVISSYNPVTHFIQADQPRGNLSLTIDSGKFQGVPWPKELWFYRAIPAKKPGRAYDFFQAISGKNIRRAFLGQIALTRSRSWLTAPHSAALMELIGWVALFEGALPALKYASRSIQTSQWFDSALIPEVIYHEWTHLLLSPIFGLRHSTSVNEGYANYSAAKISGMNQLLAKTPKNYARGRYASVRSGEDRPTYRTEFDDSPAFRSSGQFVFTVLMEIETVLGPELGRTVNIGALDYLDAESDAFHALPDALLKSVRKFAPQSPDALTAILSVLRGRGLVI